MGLPYDLGVNLAAASIGAALGAGFGSARAAYRRIVADKFWRFLDDPTMFVVGELRFTVILGSIHEALSSEIEPPEQRLRIADILKQHIEQQEISGLVGRGDFEALAMLNLFQATRSHHTPRAVFDSDIDRMDSTNLVLIGGPDVNLLTRNLAPRLGCQLKFIINHQGWNSVYDARLGTEYPTCDSVNAQGEPIRIDYGILARGRNPEDSSKVVLLLSGAHGWGTAAATDVAIQPKYRRRLRRELQDSGGHFEALVRSEHLLEPNGATQHNFATLEFMRPIFPNPTGGGAGP